MVAHTVYDALHEFRPSVAFKQFSVSLPERKDERFSSADYASQDRFSSN